MENNRKRTFADMDINPIGPHAKKSRQEKQSTPPPLFARNKTTPSLAPSSPTLIGSVHSSPSSTHGDSGDSGLEPASSGTSTSEGSGSEISNSGSGPVSTSSSNDSSSVSGISLPYLPAVSSSPAPPLGQPGIDISETSDSGTSSDSLTSTSASISDDNSESSSSGSPEEDLSGSSSSTSDGSNSSSHSIRATTGSLTAKNLSTLQLRLNSLLPKLQDANERLEKLRADGRLEEKDIENVKEGDGEGYIEMDLGLGVLEQRVSEREDNSESEGESKSESEQCSERTQGDRKAQKQDVIVSLLKDPDTRKNGKVKIEEVEG